MPQGPSIRCMVQPMVMEFTLVRRPVYHLVILAWATTGVEQIKNPR